VPEKKEETAVNVDTETVGETTAEAVNNVDVGDSGTSVSETQTVVSGETDTSVEESVTTDSEIAENVEEEIEISLNMLTLNNKPVDVYEANQTIYKDELLDEKFIIKGQISDAKYIKLIRISTDDGSNFIDIKNEQASGIINFEYSYIPNESKLFVYKLIIIDKKDKEYDDNYFQGLKINYVNETNEDMINQLMDDFCNAMETNDRDLFMDCVSEDFTGNNEGFTDYNEIKTSIKKVFDKTSTLSCNYNNLKADIYSTTRAKIEFTFKRELNFIEIDRRVSIEVEAEFELIKTDDKWQILTDKSNLLFMKYFAPVPGPPE
jgi:hypothetical protein